MARLEGIRGGVALEPIATQECCFSLHSWVWRNAVTIKLCWLDISVCRCHHLQLYLCWCHRHRLQLYLCWCHRRRHRLTNWRTSTLKPNPKPTSRGNPHKVSSARPTSQINASIAEILFSIKPAQMWHSGRSRPNCGALSVRTGTNRKQSR